MIGMENMPLARPFFVAFHSMQGVLNLLVMSSPVRFWERGVHGGSKDRSNLVIY
jgi:hypothetical protein